MVVQARVIWDEAFARYDFGPGHPMSPLRLDLTARLCRELGLFDDPSLVQVVGAEPASDELLRTVHDQGYIDAVRAASADPRQADAARGLGTEDDPAFLGMHEASARVVSGTVDVALAVCAGEARHGVNFCGGLHHAMPDRASGFCVYNDVAAGIRAMLAAGARRVAYVDVDVHHGDGVERIFWDDPRVLTVSLHESGRALFPGTGFADELGGTTAEGDAVNVALPPGTGDAGWLRAVHSVVPQLVRAFRPDVLVTQHGCDSHVLDPLAHLAVTVDAQRAVESSLHDLAHEVCEGRWVALGGGGYEVVDVVPRTWSHLVGIASHQPVPPETEVPRAWLDHVELVFGRPGPRRMTDGAQPWWRSWEVGYDPDDAVDRAVMATRKAVFPLHGLDPWFD
jgi:acetoin utilization protein AcuC